MRNTTFFYVWAMFMMLTVVDGVRAQFVTFTVGGADNTYITCINDSNVFGGYYSVGSAIHGFVYDGVDTTFINYPGAMQTYVHGINNWGDLVGAYNTTGSITDNEGFKFDGIFGTYTDITSGWIGSQDITIARDINDNGCVVG